MSSVQAPSWAFLAGAIDGAGDTHLPFGVHVRALPSARLGIPATPLVVSRAIVEASTLLQLAATDGLTWIDSKGALLTLPFTVTPDNPVYGYFPKPDVVWARLEVQPASTSTASFLFEAMGDSSTGPGALQSAAQAPFVVSHWTIPRVRLSGSGKVSAIRWLDNARLRGHEETGFWKLWSLPVKAAPRYTPPANALAEADKRVDRAGVRRQPMHVAFNASGPAAAPLATGADALARVGQVKPNLDKWLDVLLHDLSHPTWALQESQALTGQHPGSAAGTMGLGIEKFLLISSIDPDVGHYLGLGDVDQTAKASAGSLVLYKIRGLFRVNPAVWSFSELVSLWPAERVGRAQAISQFPELTTYQIEPTEDGIFYDLHQYAVAVLGQPPQGMTAPQLDAPADGGWLSTPAPPNVRRTVRLIGNGFSTPALAAVAASDQYGQRTLHAFPKGLRMTFGKPNLPPGMPLPWVVSQPLDPQHANQGSFEDRNAPAGAVQYRIAKGDWFGRWSAWGAQTSPAKVRTPPTRPALLIYAEPPQFAPPPADPPGGLLAGVIELRIPMPGIDDLPAGGAELTQLDLVETFGANAAATSAYPLANLAAGAKIILDPSSLPGHPQHILVIRRSGPALWPATKIKVSYTARWKDVLSHFSLDAFPAAKTIVDPRPPASPVIFHPLAYTARPDAMGHARVEFEFDGVDGVRYRVYASTETTLIKVLKKSLDENILKLADDIENLAMINDRAAALVDNRTLFGWDHFELITEQPLQPDPLTHKVKFIHRVSASLNVAVFFRVVAEGPHGGLSELSKSSMFAFGVPNVGAPGQPLVSVVNVQGKNPAEHGVLLRVKVPHGPSKPAAWRLRRTSTPGADPMRMPIVLEGTVPPLPAGAVADPEGRSFDIVAPAALKPWVNYRFVVEVQGESPPGATPAEVVGDWGDASGPVKLAVMPKEAPLAAQQVTVTPLNGGMQIQVKPAALANLAATMMGNFSFETWRIEQAARPVKLDLLFSYDQASHTWTGFDPAAVPDGAITSVSVRVVDPLGRIGAPTLSNSI